MERWSCKKGKRIEDVSIDKFISEIALVCKKHNMTISHEDGHGAFVIEKYDQENIDWLRHAHDGRDQYI